MNRGRENKLIVAGGGVVVVLVVAVLIVASQSSAGGAGGGAALATATPVASDQAKAEAVALLNTAVQQRAQGQFGVALELGDQALGKWPGYDAAQRFVSTVVPQATAAQQTADAKAAAAAQVAVTQAQAGANTRRVYSAKAGLSLQRYADALGSFYQKNREAREQPALLLDTTWRFRSAAAMATMQAAAGELTALSPVPPDMAAAVELFTQLATETTQLSQDYARGLNSADTQAVPITATRLDRVRDLIGQANVEVRRGAPLAPPAP
jgi:hypothetical protein